jgi:hypothetical protein
MGNEPNQTPHAPKASPKFAPQNLGEVGAFKGRYLVFPKGKQSPLGEFVKLAPTFTSGAGLKGRQTLLNGNPFGIKTPSAQISPAKQAFLRSLPRPDLERPG